MQRRGFLSLVGAALAPAKTYRVAIAGATGRGDFGHDWDVAWNGMPGVEVAAVSDVDEQGRARAAARSHARKTYADYRRMIETEKPDIVTICPRWLDQRVAMAKAAAEAGAHMLIEKPLALSLEDADEIVSLAGRHRVKVQVGHTARIVPVTVQAREMVRRGELGMLMEMRARGKEDKRAGGEDMIVLGTHCFDLMRYFAGDPQWVFASVNEKGRGADRGMARKATEPVGNVVGDDIAAMFRFRGGVPGYFGSKASDVPRNDRFGVTLYGSKGMAYLPLTAVPSAPPYVMRDPSWAGGRWERVDYLAGTKAPTRVETNALMAADLIEAIEKGREPVCSARDARWTIEMVTGVYQSHFRGGPVRFPLEQRRGAML
ncbi:MAG: Gfo/Idh/MocA family oxidoreductase [Bryobacterales bacterium]|nr:Gfo/Idh/MocA family oxidoreductase [Bryobacterales bacterium]